MLIRKEAGKLTKYPKRIPMIINNIRSVIFILIAIIETIKPANNKTLSQDSSVKYDKAISPLKLLIEDCLKRF